MMLGFFSVSLFQKGLLLTSILTIWLHGTIEIISIVMAGGAGMIMGNSWVFPGTYDRLTSLKRGALTEQKWWVRLREKVSSFVHHRRFY